MRPDRLHQHAGGVGGDTEGRGERLLPGRVHDRRAAGRPRILDPPAHGAAIDGASVAGEAVLDAEQRHALSVLEHDDVREQRRRRERTRERLGRHRRGVDRGLAVRAEDLILDPRQDQAPHAATLVGELAALLEVDARRLALLDQLLVERVGDLDALLFERQLAQVAPAGRLALLLALLVVVAVSVRRRVRWLVAERARERVELTQLGRELDLQLRGIDALGLGDEDASLEQLELLPQPCVRGAELIALLGQHFRHLRANGHALRSRARRRERRPLSSRARPSRANR